VSPFALRVAASEATIRSSSPPISTRAKPTALSETHTALPESGRGRAPRTNRPRLGHTPPVLLRSPPATGQRASRSRAWGRRGRGGWLRYSTSALAQRRGSGQASPRGSRAVTRSCQPWTSSHGCGGRGKAVASAHSARSLEVVTATPRPTSEPVQHVCTLPPRGRGHTPPTEGPHCIQWGMRPCCELGN
jgi:hypothetical protein